MQQLSGLQVGLSHCGFIERIDEGNHPSILRICNMHRPGVFLRAFTCAVAASDENHIRTAAAAAFLGGLWRVPFSLFLIPSA
jgi:hypothetical protein